MLTMIVGIIAVFAAFAAGGALAKLVYECTQKAKAKRKK